jgi:hypothetical protein
MSRILTIYWRDIMIEYYVMTVVWAFICFHLIISNHKDLNEKDKLFNKMSDKWKDEYIRVAIENTNLEIELKKHKRKRDPVTGRYVKKV